MGVSFVTVGNFNIDNVVTADGMITLQNIGGNVVYAAIGAHIWSSSVGILSVIPDNYPAAWLDELERAGIDLSGVRTAAPSVDLEEWFFYRPDGSRLDHIYAPSTAQMLAPMGVSHSGQFLTPDQVNSLAEWVKNYPINTGISFSQFRALNPLKPEYISDIYWPILGCHIAPNPYAEQMALAKAFKAKGVMISLDPPFNLVDQQCDQQSVEERLAALLAQVDIFLPSQKELQALYPNKTHKEAILSMAGMGPAVIGVKLGGNGSLIWDRNRDELLHIPAYPSKVTNPTGAGDAYCGGFLVGMIETSDPFIAAQFGSVAASLVIERGNVSTALRFNRYQASLRLSAFQQALSK